MVSNKSIIKVVEITRSGFKEIDYSIFIEAKPQKSSLYIIDIEVDSRADAIEELANLGVSSSICALTLTPSQNIRFEYFDNTLYGEIAYFSSKIKEEHYAGIIIEDNFLIGVHRNK